MLVGTIGGIEMKHPKRALVLGAAAATATAVLTGLAIAGNSANNPPGLSAITNPPAAVTTAPKIKPKYITVRVWSGPYQKAFAVTVARQFTKATGVGVHWDTTDELVSYQKIAQEIRSGIRPEADASMQAQQRAYLDAVRGLTLPISTKVAPNMTRGIFAIAAPEGTPKAAQTWAYANPYSVTVSLVVNTAKVNPKLLTKWSDLFSPKYRHSIVLDQTFWSTAFPLAKAMGIDWTKNPPRSMDPVWKRIKTLRPNLAALGNGQDITTALTNGNASIAVTCTCNVISAISSGAKLALVVPRDGMFMVADAYYIHKGIPAGNYYYAQLFANYLYSAQTQAYLAKDQGLVPSVPGTPVPQYMKDQPRAFPLTAAEIKAANGVVAPIPLIARYNDQWQLAFENAIK
jgi:putative spermidine/putrescine transport system substrate-binding protein